MNVKKVLIVGHGGHGLVVADILLLAKGLEPLGFVARDGVPGDRGAHGLPVFGTPEVIQDIEHDGVVIAIGDNLSRQKEFSLLPPGEKLVSAIHPSAVIAKDAILEPGCMVCAGVVVNSKARVGGNAILNTGCTIDHDNVIEDFAHVAPGVHLAGDVTVKTGALMGIGSCALPGVNVGMWSTVGAGSVVTRDVPENTLVGGAPARPLR